MIHPKSMAPRHIGHRHGTGYQGKCRCYAVIWVAVCLLMLTAVQPSLADVVETFDSGIVNWTRGFVSAKGEDTPDEKNHRQTDCQKALSAARLNAFQKLLETVKDIRIDSTVRVGDFAGTNDGVMARLMEMVKEAEIVNQEYLTNGSADVVLRLNLFNGFSQLVLPDEIEHVEPVKPVAKNKPDSDYQNGGGGQPDIPEKDIYSGLIVDARGLDVKPMMMLKIFDEHLQEVYGPAFISREMAVQKGMCRYMADMASARIHPSSGTHPLMVKGLRANESGDIVISNADALKLKSASEHLKFLRRGNVIVLIDADDAAPAAE